MLAADTVVALGRRLLGKPADARRGRRLPARCSPAGGTASSPPSRSAAARARWSRAVETAVRFKRLVAAEIAAYLASGEWRGKAGGYAIQGRAAGFVPWIGGSYSNVVGLPLTETLGAARRPPASPRAP